MKIASLYLLISFVSFQSFGQELLLPIHVENRTSLAGLRLTEIGSFGLIRKARPGIPSHHHTGVDIKRPSGNYENDPIFPIAEGVVISKRDDGPYAQVIIEHNISGEIFWSIYEHIAGIRINLHDLVSTEQRIARFMNRQELNEYGWQFDHFHLEILKKSPVQIVPTTAQKERHFMSYTLRCYTEQDLTTFYYDPISFLRDNL